MCGVFFYVFMFRNWPINFALHVENFNLSLLLRSEVLTAMLLKVLFFLDMTPCIMVYRYHCFLGAYCFQGNQSPG